MPWICCWLPQRVPPKFHCVQLLHSGLTKRLEQKFSVKEGLGLQGAPWSHSEHPTGNSGGQWDAVMPSNHLSLSEGQLGGWL
mmetsp:Transcript_22875/g.58649  ORF Transcript_22875/g.58649 Transcript_22875/m.58649 type:complete len:82 (-) Transcript_22875:331-576(-)